MAALIFGSAGIASADTWAFTDIGPGSQTGNAPVLLANSFAVTAGSTVDVDNIGVFVNAAVGQLTATPLGNLEVAIVDSTGAVVAGTDTVFPNGTQYSVNGADIYQALSSPIALTAGNSYFLEVLGYNNPDLNGNTKLGDPAPLLDASGNLSFGISAYTLNDGAFGVPLITDDGPIQPEYEIGTFSYEAPEPGTFGMFGLGSVLVFAILRRKLNNSTVGKTTC
jgi:hypothetical protein